MLRLLIELGIGATLVYSVYYFRKKYRKEVLHHQTAAKLWQKMMMNIMSEQVGQYFKNTPCITNHIVCLRQEKIEIAIGDEEVLLPVNMDLFKEDVDKAFEDAYNRFVTYAR